MGLYTAKRMGRVAGIICLLKETNLCVAQRQCSMTAFFYFSMGTTEPYWCSVRQEPRQPVDRASSPLNTPAPDLLSAGLPASSPVVPGESGCDVTHKACGRPPPLTRIARVGLGTRLQGSCYLSEKSRYGVITESKLQFVGLLVSVIPWGSQWGGGF